MNGIINCYKPEGITSFDAVAKIKKTSKEKKVGHTGTLDPAASGVLPICLGKATKLIDLIMNGNKKYEVELILGTVTDTYDKEGKIIETKDVEVCENEIIGLINSFKGEIMQVPPMYSALKVNGKRLYELARKGIEVERQARKVTIYDINIINIKNKTVKFDVVCSKGTYIRSLCFDIGNMLGCGAMMGNLKRKSSGIFNIENSINVLDLNENNIYDSIISMEEVLKIYTPITVNKKFYTLLKNGVKVSDKSLIANLQDGLYRVYDEENNLVGIGKMGENQFKLQTLLI
ncbi:tRNA pseudouridine(55) synthase TruB [Clostridium sp. 19966]|uniref:tRNA pseudouridine(55) synthase TruB n=1 Tax=Clostridium sp. 19966 TaxID=2768166 RepID=UPI0028DF6426|nr:tRNA pseudouridine(55) synthase TruB [Clostridium sp. 19966]MDT8716416.1 tRNA pseudouridine(55) synthase TruB [Clostridium sp. 19966]